MTLRILQAKKSPLQTADTLSCAPIQIQTLTDVTELQHLTGLCMMSTVVYLPTSSQQLQSYKQHSLQTVLFVDFQIL